MSKLQHTISHSLIPTIETPGICTYNRLIDIEAQLYEKYSKLDYPTYIILSHPRILRGYDIVYDAMLTRVDIDQYSVTYRKNKVFLTQKKRWVINIKKIKTIDQIINLSVKEVKKILKSGKK